VLGPVHKSERGGVQLGLVGHDVVAAAYERMAGVFGGEMTGGLLQPMASSDGVESIVGGIQDPSFGPLVVFGLGGITVEVLRDHVTRLAPLTDADALEMVTGLRGSPLLTGYRGRPPVDVDSLVQVLHRVSRLVEELPEVAELDCNPVIAGPEGALVVDARLRVGADASGPLADDTRHLR
jgi:acyl-CoA synthetase (NDP forming)